MFFSGEKRMFKIIIWDPHIHTLKNEKVFFSHLILQHQWKSFFFYLGEGSILVDDNGSEGATGVTNKLDDVDGMLIFGGGDECGGDIECADDGDGIFVLDCTCFNKFATSRLFIILRGNVFARFGAKCSSIASSFIISIKLAPFMSSFWSCKIFLWNYLEKCMDLIPLTIDIRLRWTRFKRSFWSSVPVGHISLIRETMKLPGGPL